MPRYFFSLENGNPVSEEEGEELADDKAAWAEAAEIAHDLARNRENIGSFRIVVRSADGRIVCEVPLKITPL
jgi:hypothetical protein